MNTHMSALSRMTAAATLALASGAVSGQALVSPGDIAVGWSLSNTTNTIQLYSAGGVLKKDQWNQFGFIQSVEWDNSGGIPHNPSGNLIGLNFGTTAAGFSLYAYESGTGWAGVEMFNAGVSAPSFATLGLLTSRGGGLSVSPDNTKISVAGSDTGQLYIFDYDAAARTITGGRQTEDLPPTNVTGDTAGTVWLDATTVVSLSSNGELRSVDVTQGFLTSQLRITLPGMGLGGTEFTSLAYRPAVAPYLYASYGQFSTVTSNTLYIIDPRTTPWTVVATADFSTSASSTMREIALADSGDLYFSTHGVSANLPTVQRVAGVTSPGSVSSNSSVAVLTGPSSSSFNGLDVAGGTAGPKACYANCDESTVQPVLNVADFTCFLQRFAAGESYANCDESTVEPVLNVADFTCFLQAFAAGCP